jgi:hypothetical protein
LARHKNHAFQEFECFEFHYFRSFWSQLFIILWRTIIQHELTWWFSNRSPFRLGSTHTCDYKIVGSHNFWTNLRKCPSYWVCSIHWVPQTIMFWLIFKLQRFVGNLIILTKKHEIIPCFLKCNLNENEGSKLIMRQKKRVFLLFLFF